MYMTCVLAIYTGGLHAQAHVMATAASSAHARVHWERCSHMHAHNQSSLTQERMYTYIYRYIYIHIHTYIKIYVYMTCTPIPISHTSIH
jgi:hypothetical protein